MLHLQSRRGRLNGGGGEIELPQVLRAVHSAEYFTMNRRLITVKQSGVSRECGCQARRLGGRLLFRPIEAILFVL